MLTPKKFRRKIFAREDEEDLLEEYGASSAEVVNMKEVATRKADTPGFFCNII